MRAAVWNEQGSLDVVDRPDPEPRPGWVRITVATVGICGTDLHFFRGAFPSPTGLLPGHEVGGIVDRVGEATDEGPLPESGQAVAVEPLGDVRPVPPLPHRGLHALPQADAARRDRTGWDGRVDDGPGIVDLRAAARAYWR